MNFQDRNPRWAMLPERIRGMFNLNDPRWGAARTRQRMAVALSLSAHQHRLLGGVGVIPAQTDMTPGDLAEFPTEAP